MVSILSKGDYTLENDKGEITLTNSAEFNAVLWAARSDGNDEFAEDLLSMGKWENAGVGTLTRQVELDTERSKEVIRLIGEVVSGQVLVHPTHRASAEDMAGQLLFSPAYFDYRREHRASSAA